MPPSSGPDSRPAPAKRDPLSWALLGVGVLLRVAQYLANRSLWLDEAYLAPTILRRSFAELLRPPDHGQIVPVGFLALERAAVALFGGSEYALRLVPLLAGVVALFLFHRVAVRTLPRKAIPLAVALFVFCDPLIYFSSELKQYSLDVAIALLLLDRALASREDPGRQGPIAALALLGTAAIWFSHAAALVLAGVGSTLAASAFLRRDRKRMAALAGAGLFWIASFAAFYAVSLSKIGRSPDVLAFWDSSFPPLPPRSFEDLYWLPRALGALFGDPAGLVFRGLGILCFLVGVSVLLASDRVRLALFVAPLLFALLAAGLRWYPFEGRLLLFLVPSVLLLMAEGAERIRRATASTAPAISTILVVLLLFHPVLFAARALVRPRTREEIEPALAYLRERWRPGDRLYLYAASAPAFDYYALRYGLDPGDALRGSWAYDRGDPRADLERLRGGDRTWLLFSHAQRASGVEDDEKRFLSLLDPVGKRLAGFRAPGAAVYLYDVSRRPEGEPRS